MKMKQLSQIGIAIVFTALSVVTIMDRMAKQPHTVQGQMIDEDSLAPFLTNDAVNIVSHSAYGWKLEHDVPQGEMIENDGRIHRPPSVADHSTNRPVGMTNNVWHEGIIQNESPKYQEEPR